MASKKDLLQSLEALSESLSDKVSELQDKDSSIEEDDDRFPEDMAGKSEWYDETYMYQEVAMNYSYS